VLITGLVLQVWITKKYGKDIAVISLQFMSLPLVAVAIVNRTGTIPTVKGAKFSLDPNEVSGNLKLGSHPRRRERGYQDSDTEYHAADENSIATTARFQHC
jgi:hypothetical protein